MRKTNLHFILIPLFGLVSNLSLTALSDKIRCTWRDNPATSMVIAWDQVQGANPVVYFDVVDQGRNFNAYKLSRKPDRIISAKGMNNHFVRLSGLQPNTTYYFIIKDSEGSTVRYSFRTAPDQPTQRLSIIAGGDSRNHREARKSANLLVAKLRPHFVLFNGDMTVNDSSTEWEDWLKDWQLTIAPNGHITPVLVARGNHESENKTLIDMFDLAHPGNFYAFNFGGNLLRIYTLNTLIPAGGEQKNWLENDLKTQGASVVWKITQYHHAMRPHTAAKTEKDDLYLAWAQLFHDQGVKLAIESDSHVAKWTYPLRPDTGPGSDMGFIRDDATGTVFVGEGCWGAPLRESDDNKSWTRASGSFNHFNWIFIDQEKIEVRSVMTDGAEGVGEVPASNIFEPPIGLSLWSPPGGDVIRIYKKKPPVTEPAPAKERPHHTSTPAASAESDDLGGNWEALPRVVPNPASGKVKIDYDIAQLADVTLILVNAQKQEMARLDYTAQTPGPYSKSLDLVRLPAGRYLLVVRAGKKAVKRYLVVKG